MKGYPDHRSPMDKKTLKPEDDSEHGEQPDSMYYMPKDVHTVTDIKFTKVKHEAAS